MVRNLFKESSYSSPTPIIPLDSNNLSIYLGKRIIVTPAQWNHNHYGMEVIVGNPNIGIALKGFIPASEFCLQPEKTLKQAFSIERCKYPMMVEVKQIFNGIFILSRKKVMEETYKKFLNHPEDTYLGHIVGYTNYYVLVEIGFGLVGGIALKYLNNSLVIDSPRDYISFLYHNSYLPSPEDIPVKISGWGDHHKLFLSYKETVEPLKLSVGDLVRGKVCGWLDAKQDGLLVELNPVSTGLINPYHLSIFDPKTGNLLEAKDKYGYPVTNFSPIEIGQSYSFIVKKVRSYYRYKLVLAR